MKININRMCKLAGVGTSQSRRSNGLLREGSNSSFRDDPSYRDEAEFRFGRGQLNEQDDDFVDDSEMDDLPLDEEVVMDDEMAEGEDELEVDEAMLVQELRRAKRIVNESRKHRRRQLSENAKLQRIIEEEVANVMHDYNYNSQWLYGKRKPRRSRNGYTAQGSYIPGIGFKNPWE